MFFNWRPYVPVAERRQRAMRELGRRRKQGHPVSPVVIEGRTIAHTFWGKAWCENLEHYSDYANRLPRGRTYVRNGSVVDLQIGAGEVVARVSGSELYEVSIKVAPVPEAAWRSLCADAAGAIDSLVELLQGRFAKGVMERLCQQRTGLFPAPRELAFSCSCPDWASMCKHVAAVCYGIGARLDSSPELLFKLRQVSEGDLISKASAAAPLSKRAPASTKILADDDLAGMFGLDLAAGERPAEATTKAAKAARGPRAKVAPKRPAKGRDAGKARGTAKGKRAGKKKGSARLGPILRS